MTTPYRKGYRFEKRVVRRLLSVLSRYSGVRSKIVESRKSRGSADILVGLTYFDGRMWFGIQCKKIRPSGRYMKNAMARACLLEGMILFFAFSVNRQVEFYPDLDGFIKEFVDSQDRRFGISD